MTGASLYDRGRSLGQGLVFMTWAGLYERGRSDMGRSL